MTIEKRPLTQEQFECIQLDIADLILKNDKVTALNILGLDHENDDLINVLNISKLFKEDKNGMLTVFKLNTSDTVLRLWKKAGKAYFPTSSSKLPTTKRSANSHDLTKLQKIIIDSGCLMIDETFLIIEQYEIDNCIKEGSIKIFPKYIYAYELSFKNKLAVISTMPFELGKEKITDLPHLPNKLVKTADDIIFNKVKDYLMDMPNEQDTWEAIVSEVRVDPVLLKATIDSRTHSIELIRKSDIDLNPMVKLK